MSKYSVGSKRNDHLHREAFLYSRAKCVKFRDSQGPQCSDIIKGKARSCHFIVNDVVFEELSYLLHALMRRLNALRDVDILCKSKGKVKLQDTEQFSHRQGTYPLVR